MAETVYTIDRSDRGSREYVAWMLLKSIAAGEDKMVGEWIKADKEWILRNYAQCYQIASGTSVEVALRR